MHQMVYKDTEQVQSKVLYECIMHQMVYKDTEQV